MLRRVIALGVTLMAVLAGQALADTTQWNAPPPKSGTDTSSRQQSGGCSFHKGPALGSLVVVCPRGGSATLSYTFSSQDRISGLPDYSFDLSTKQLLRVFSSVGVKDSHRTIRVRLTVNGAATVTISSVSVRYFTG